MAEVALRTGNPALATDTFRDARVRRGDAAMTIRGTVDKTALALALLFVAAGYTWGLGVRDPRVPGLIMLGVFGGLVTSVATIFRQPWAPYTTPLYAVCEGLALGGISLTFETRFPGLVPQAVFLTFGTLGGLLVAYLSGLVRVTDNLRRGIFAATAGIGLVYLASFVGGLFGAHVPLIHSSGAVGIAFSVVVVGVAAFNLVLDFDLIERSAARGAPRYMEWYGAFALLVTLVWLYLELLRLLAKLQERE